MALEESAPLATDLSRSPACTHPLGAGALGIPDLLRKLAGVQGRGCSRRSRGSAAARCVSCLGGGMVRGGGAHSAAPLAAESAYGVEVVGSWLAPRHP